MKKKDRELWLLVVQLFTSYSAAFGLDLRDVRPIKRKHRGRVLASCSKRGLIRIDLRDAAGKLHNAYDFIDTIAHELAHLKYQNHGSNWFELHCQILDLMRLSGEYPKIRKALKKKYSVI